MFHGFFATYRNSSSIIPLRLISRETFQPLGSETANQQSIVTFATIVTMKIPSRKPRAKHSFRESIRESILTRMAKGEPLHIRKIIEDAGGGSVTTVQQELASLTGAQYSRKSLLIGRGASTVQARVSALEEAIEGGFKREETLKAQVVVLQQALDHAQGNLAMLLRRHEDSQRELLQGVDDLRQMVKAGKEGEALTSIHRPVAETQYKETRPKEDCGEQVAYWRTKCNELIEASFTKEDQFRKLKARLHELGEDF